ncbi:MAG: AAA family ATPase, partial [Proteobacteria bacterium]|nr:AAA family ATPase [Pseudomonadota bacterium]
MLELLRIRDLALIEDVELEFAPGLNTLTGETGAGKSFIMRAVDFLLGERMDVKLVRPGKEKASVEALFVLP